MTLPSQIQPVVAIAIRFASMGLSLASTIIVSRLFGVNGNGIFQTSQSAINVASQFVSLGLPVLILKRGVKNKSTNSLFYIKIMIFAVLFSSIVIIPCYYWYFSNSGSGREEVFVFLLAVISFVGVLLMTIKHGCVERLKSQMLPLKALRSEFFDWQLMSIILLWFIWFFAIDYNYLYFVYPLALLLAADRNCLVGLLGGCRRVTTHRFIVSLGSARYYWFNAVVNSLRINSPVLIIGAIYGVDKAGSFGLAFRIVLIVVAVNYSLSSVFVPRIYDLHLKGLYKESVIMYRRAVAMSVIVFVSIVACVYLFLDYLLKYLGAEFNGVKDLLGILLIGSVMSSIASVAEPILQMVGSGKKVLAINVVTTLLFLILVMLTHFSNMGVQGVVISYAVSLSMHKICILFVKRGFQKTVSTES